MKASEYFPNRPLPALDGIDLPPGKKRPQPIEPYTTIWQQNVALTPRPTTRVHARKDKSLAALDPHTASFASPYTHIQFNVFTCPVTHRWFRVLNRRTYWWVLVELEITTDHRGAYFRPTPKIEFVHFLQFRDFIPGAWS